MHFLKMLKIKKKHTNAHFLVVVELIAIKSKEPVQIFEIQLKNKHLLPSSLCSIENNCEMKQMKRNRRIRPTSISANIFALNYQTRLHLTIRTVIT